MFKPTAFLLLAGLAVAQPGPGVVTQDDVKRLAQRLVRLDPGTAPKLTPEQLDTLRKLLDANPELKKRVEQGAEEFKKLPPDQQRAKLDALKRAATDPAVQKQLDQLVPRKSDGLTDGGKREAGAPRKSGPTNPTAEPSDTDAGSKASSRQPGQPRPPDGRSAPRPPSQDGSSAVGRPKPSVVDAPAQAAPGPTPTSLPQSSPTPSAGGRARTGYEKFARFWEQNVGPLKDMPAVRQLAQELFRGHADRPADGDAGPLAELIDPKAVDNLLKGLPETSGERGDGWNLPGLGGMADALDRPSFSPAAFSPPEPPPAGWVGVIVGLLLLAGLLAVVFRLFPRLAADAEPQPVPGLGPWPLDPRTVQTRADLVRAFEYLSVLLNGHPARAFNHEAAASALRAAVPEAADSAAPLADAYALARYTPADQPLPVAAIADARRHLCRLAGVPVA